MELNGIGGGYTLNYPEILKNKDVMSVTKLLAHRLMANPYITVGEYIQQLADADLDTLQHCIEAEQYEDIILIAEMLATAEGCDQSPDFDAFKERANGLVGFLTVESLGRKGLVKVYHENMSFSEDMKDKLLVEKIDGLDYNSIIKGFNEGQ